MASPEVVVEVGSERFAARAEVTEEPERTALYARMAEQMPIFDEYQSKTERVIPVVRLARS